MKRLFLVLVCAALANTAWAQAPAQTLPPAFPTAGTVIHSVQKTTTPFLQAPIQQVSGGRQACGNDSCKTDCVPTKTICIPEAGTKIVTTINYSSLCSKICYPKCTLWGSKCCDSGCGDKAQCHSHIYKQNYLIKKVCTTECAINKCVAVEVPVCQPACQPDCVQGVPGHAVLEPAVVVPPTKK